MGSNPAHDFEDEDLDQDADEIDGDQATKNHDEIEISDHFTRRSSRRSGRAMTTKFSTGHTSSTQSMSYKKYFWKNDFYDFRNSGSNVAHNSLVN